MMKFHFCYIIHIMVNPIPTALGPTSPLTGDVPSMIKVHINIAAMRHIAILPVVFGYLILILIFTLHSCLLYILVPNRETFSI